MNLKATIFAALALSCISFPTLAKGDFTYGKTFVKSNAVEFCKNHGSCGGSGGLITSLSSVRSVASSVNRSVNHATTYTADIGPDVWSYTTKGKGDCEDYALTKRRILIGKGLPASSLRIVVVRMKGNGALHALLAIHAKDGMMFLDLFFNSPLTYNQVLQYYSFKYESSPNNLSTMRFIQ